MKKRKAARKAKAAKPRRQGTAFGSYANHATVRFGVGDATIEFSRTYPDGAGGWPSEPVSRVTVPLAVTKVLIYHLLSYITPFEAMTGTVPVPPAQVPELSVSQLIRPDVMAKLIAAHGELFPPHTIDENRPEFAESGALTKH